MRTVTLIVFLLALPLASCGSSICSGTSCVCDGIGACDMSSEGTCNANIASCNFACKGTGSCSGTCGDNCNVAISGTGAATITTGKSSNVSVTGPGAATINVGAGSSVACSGTGNCATTCSGACTHSCTATGTCTLTCSGSTKVAAGCQ